MCIKNSEEWFKIDLDGIEKSKQNLINHSLKLLGAELDNTGLGEHITVPISEFKGNYCYDKLDQIFADQKEFTKQIYFPYQEQDFNCYNFEKEDFDLYYTLQRAATELHEAAELVNSKIWSKKHKTIDRAKLLEELVDSSKFIHQAILFLGYGAPDYYEMHQKKSEINKKRQEQGY